MKLNVLLPGLLCCCNLLAERYFFRHFGGDEGLSQLSCKYLLQDRSGFIWFGTQAGLNRFDGDGFDIFAIQEGLESDFIQALCLDPSDRIWVGTGKGLGLIENGVVTRFYREPKGVSVITFYRGDLWYGTEDALFRLKNPGNGAWNPEPIPGFSRPKCFLNDSQGGLWVGGSQGLFYFVDGTWQRVWSGPEDEPVLALQENGEGRPVAVTPRGLYEFDGDRQKVLHDTSNLKDIQCFLIDSYGIYWIGTEWGLWMWDGKKTKVFTKENGLPFNLIDCLMQDHEGLLWIGGFGGAATFNGRAFTVYSEADGLPSSNTRPIFRDGEGILWVGTLHGPCRFDGETWESFENRGLVPQRIRCFETESADQFWMGGTKGLYYYENQSFHKIPFFKGDEITSMDREPGGDLWVSVRNRGVFKGDGQNFEKVLVPNQSFSNAIIYASPRGDLWVSGDYGLSHFDGKNWKTYTVDDGLAYTKPYFICGNARGEIWFGYHASVGFTHFDGTAFTTYTTRDGLCNNTVYSLGVDRANNLWVGTARGLDRYDGQVFTNFGVNDGFPSYESNAHGFFEEEDGTIWFSTPEGLARYDPRFDLTGETFVKTNLRASIGDRVLKPGQPVEVGHKVNELKAKVKMLSYIDRKHLESRYRILGYQEEWQYLEGQNLPMVKLPPGRYSLEIQTRKYQWPWASLEGFHFEIQPPFWRTAWFFILLFLLGAGSVMLLIKWRTRVLSIQKRRLEELVATKTEDLVKANENLKQLSLTDALTGLHNRRFFREQIGILMAGTQRLQANAYGRSENRNNHLTFFLIDLDFFKNINDTYGHDCGDQVLKTTATFLLGCIRESDLLVRWGGEEFLVVAQHTNPDSANGFAERIRSGLESLPMDVGRERELSVTCSLGFVSFPFAQGITPELTWEHLVQIADQSLYSAKAAGRNTWVGVRAAKLNLASGEIDTICDNLKKAHSDGLVRLVVPEKWEPSDEESERVSDHRPSRRKPPAAPSTLAGFERIHFVEER